MCWSPTLFESSDFFGRVYTTGATLQDLLKPQGRLPLCDHRLPRLTDGTIQLVYNGCPPSGFYPYKFFELPIDTRQSTLGGEGLYIHKPGLCADGSQARRARYLDDKCEHLHDITDITDETLSWSSCEQLKDTTRHFGSVDLYCSRPKNIGPPSKVTSTIKWLLLKLTSKLQKIILLPKQFGVLFWKFWKGLILVGDSNHLEFGILSSDTCYEIRSYLKVYRVPRFWNGTRAIVAFFDWAKCKGSPIIYDGADEKVLDTRFCTAQSDCRGYESMGFWCRGVEERKVEELSTWILEDDD